MPMPPYPIHCYTEGCPNLATYKIAARWSDGRQSELKTYALCCEPCLPQRYRASVEKSKACRLSAGETLEEPGIYKMKRGTRDQQLTRLPELEQSLAGNTD